MENEEALLKKRFIELGNRADARGFAEYSDFLTLAEQDLAESLENGVTFDGGYDGAERRIAVFGESYGAPPPLVWIEISPVAQKFADALTHRDFLGSLIGLGLDRSVLGDIIIHENIGFVCVLDKISDFITSELKQVKHTTVACRKVDAPPSVAVELPDAESFVVSSERIDAVVAAVFDISRAESQKLVENELVFVNSRAAKKLTKEPRAKDIISVRGYGRFIYEGIERETKKGRLRVSVRRFR